MLVTSRSSLFKVNRKGQAVHLNQSPQRARRCAHFNYCQSNLSTPPHPGSLSTRYALSSFKQNLLRTSKAWRRTSVPELTVHRQITRACTLHAACAAAQGRMFCLPLIRTVKFLPLYMLNVFSSLQLLCHLSTGASDIFIQFLWCVVNVVDCCDTNKQVFNTKSSNTMELNASPLLHLTGLTNVHEQPAVRRIGQWRNVTKHIYFSNVLKYKYKVSYHIMCIVTDPSHNLQTHLFPPEINFWTMLRKAVDCFQSVFTIMVLVCVSTIGRVQHVL